MRIRIKIENEIRGLLRTFGVLFGKRVGGIKGCAHEIICGELEASLEMRIIAETLMNARASVCDQIKVLDTACGDRQSEPDRPVVFDRTRCGNHHRADSRISFR